MLEDQQLLRQYAQTGSEAAFGELVARYVNLVYSVAFRRMGGDAHLAQDVAQLVFTDLARKAGSLPPEVVLAGWLHRATRYAAARILRANRRRQARELQAADMNALSPEPEPNWDEIRPLLDEALDQLGQEERDAVLLRFFEQRTLDEVGRALGSNEEAARKRISRALEKLRAHLVRHGLSTTAAALSAAISAHAVQVAPAGLAAALASTALTGATAGTGTTLTLLKFMAGTKVNLGIVSGLIFAGAVTSLVVQRRSQAKLSEMDAALRQQANQLAGLQTENERLANRISQASRPPANTRDELRALRGEFARLQQPTNELAGLGNAYRKWRASLAGVRQVTQKTDSRPTVPSPEVKAKTHYAMALALALIKYASDHHDQIPTNFEQAAAYIKRETKGETNLTTDQFEIVYRGSRDALTNYARPGDILLLREQKPWKNTNGRWTKLYIFTDGHGEFRGEPEIGFEQWEKRHIVPR